jgi:hypothetical protein
MSNRNVDFLAICIIALVMLGFSRAASLKVPDPIDSIQLQNASSQDRCPLNQALSRIAYILNQ